MQRFTVTLDNDLVTELDELIAARGYASRSEAIRDLMRASLGQARTEANPNAACVAAVVYTYDHHAPELSRRIASAHHDHHALTVSSMHVHMDHETCLEVSVLKGKVGDVKRFGEQLTAQRHVQNGQVVLIPARPVEGEDHSH